VGRAARVRSIFTMLGQVLRTRSVRLHWTRHETPALFACRELTAGCRVQYAALGQVRGLQRIELEIWGLKPQFSISSKLSAYARPFHKTAVGSPGIKGPATASCELRS
jgi:hypothetical protein